jgi:hypothetical protein
MKRLLLILAVIPCVLYAQTPFSSDSALSYLRTLSVTIGARPMGSVNERKAMEFAIAKFREFGLTETYLMKLETAQNDISGTATNTNSGIVVGVLRGKTDRIIVIGGHIDSASPLVPGANDDGSGSAAVIELARVLSKEQLQSTIVLCLFGGEEAGLIGSKFFVDHFSRIDSVALMLQLDMANGSDGLIPTLHSKTGDTPPWLVKAAYEEFNKLGYSGLNYPTNFFTSMSIMPGGGVGSDHEPFLEKNIPAIDFTSDLNDPIHTPQDDFEHFKPSGLKRSGDLAYALVHRFDKSEPEERTDRYYLMQIGDQTLFFPIWILSAFIIASIALAIYTILVVRKRRVETDKKQRPKIPALKLFLIALFIQTFVWLSENVIGLIKGVRFPWVAYPGGYFALGSLAGLLGIVIALRFTSYLRLSRDPYRWFIRAVVFLIAIISILSLANANITLYPAIALFCLSAAMLVQRPWLKILFWIVSPHFMFRLIFSEGFIFMSRSMALHSTQPIWMYAALNIFYIIFFALWSFPFLLGFAAVYFECSASLPLFSQWRTVKALIITASAFILCSIALLFFPSYSDEWRQNILVDQSVDLNTQRCRISLKGSEYFKDVKIHFADKDTGISTWDREILLKEFSYDRIPWVQTERSKTVSGDSSTTFDIILNIHFKYRPKGFTISYSAGKNKLSDIAGEYISSSNDHSVTMRWSAFADTAIVVPIHFRVDKADSVTETIDAKFIEMIEPVQIKKALSNIIPQTTFRKTEIIGR